MRRLLPLCEDEPEGASADHPSAYLCRMDLPWKALASLPLSAAPVAVGHFYTPMGLIRK